MILHHLIANERTAGVGRTATVSSCSFYRIFHSWQHRAGADPYLTVGLAVPLQSRVWTAPLIPLADLILKPIRHQ